MFPKYIKPEPEKDQEDEKIYTEIQQLRVFDNFSMLKADQTFQHHYNDNIIANTTSTQVLKAVVLSIVENFSNEHFN